MVRLERMWVNQPSVLQSYHGLHGSRVIALVDEAEDVWRVYFTRGPVISQLLEKNALSWGWPQHRKGRK